MKTLDDNAVFEISDELYSKINEIEICFVNNTDIIGMWDTLIIENPENKLIFIPKGIDFAILEFRSTDFNHKCVVNRKKDQYYTTKSGSESDYDYIPNASVDSIISCPVSVGELQNACFWFSPSLSSPDLFHGCFDFLEMDNWNIGVPENFAGNAGGVDNTEGYAGIITYVSADSPVQAAPGYREYMAVPFNKTLIGGNTYIVSFYYRLAAHAAYNTPLGYSFTPVYPEYLSFDALPFGAVGGCQPDTSDEWHQFTDTIVASGAEKYMVIGNFDASGPAQFEIIRPGAEISSRFGGFRVSAGYFYIDEVQVYGSGNECGQGATLVAAHAAYSDGEFSVEYSVGQVMSATLSADSVGITSGFHQPPDDFVPGSEKSVFQPFEVPVEIVAFPNPLDDFLLVAADSMGLTPELYDMSGRRLNVPVGQKVAGDVNFWRLDMRGVRSGMYLVKCVKNNSIESFTVVKM
ncbi:MAG: T9SS type A sorting domain-containing protein [Bacteroidetes bacterium]|nr:T9SS type A sorting domain-containing protein [Bacteroidota bacterium]